MNEPIHTGSRSRNVHISATLHPGPEPLDILPYLDELEDGAEIVRRHMRAAKLVHDSDLLSAALYAQARSLPLADALLEISGSVVEEAQAYQMTAAILRMAGWREETPDPVPKRVYKKGILGTFPQAISSEHDGDVLVNLSTGTTIVAAATSAYDWHWEFPWRDTRLPERGKAWEWAKVEPEDIALPGRWWWTGNYRTGLPEYPASAAVEARLKARILVTTPDLPVDLRGTLDHLTP